MYVGSQNMLKFQVLSCLNLLHIVGKPYMAFPVQTPLSMNSC